MTNCETLPAQVQRAAFERDERLEEDRDEGYNINSGVLGRALAKLSVWLSEAFELRSRTTLSPCVAYEKPTSTGWSRKNTFACDL